MFGSSKTAPEMRSLEAKEEAPKHASKIILGLGVVEGMVAQ